MNRLRDLLIMVACTCGILSGCGSSQSPNSYGPSPMTGSIDYSAPVKSAVPPPPLVSQAPAPAPTLTPPGGIIEATVTAETRPLLTKNQIQDLLPEHGAFTFPAPYNTEAVRLTNASDCAKGDNCVNPVGYSYWRNSNNHVASDTMYIFIGMDRARGGNGPTLFSYDKNGDVITKSEPLFSADSPYSMASGEGWYFSATLPTKLYMNDGAKMLRYDVVSHQFETVFDAATDFGDDKTIWQMHSSNDDLVHSATLRDNDNWEMLGCVVYRTTTSKFTFFPKKGEYDECQIDKSGRWLIIKEDLDGADGEDNVIVDIDSGDERILLDRDGAGGHSDLGFGAMIAADNWSTTKSNLQKVWPFDAGTLQGTELYSNNEWNAETPSHISFTNAKADVPLSQQYACGSSANRVNSPHSNEIICFSAGASSEVLVVAPVMTDMKASGDDYDKTPKGNLDVTGRYFIWTSNMGGKRLDAFVVKVPGQLLIGS